MYLHHPSPIEWPSSCQSCPLLSPHPITSQQIRSGLYILIHRKAALHGRSEKRSGSGHGGSSVSWASGTPFSVERHLRQPQLLRPDPLPFKTHHFRPQLASPSSFDTPFSTSLEAHRHVCRSSVVRSLPEAGFLRLCSPGALAL